jgi:hypothetical protein
MQAPIGHSIVNPLKSRPLERNGAHDVGSLAFAPEEERLDRCCQTRHSFSGIVQHWELDAGEVPDKIFSPAQNAGSAFERLFDAQPQLAIRCSVSIHAFDGPVKSLSTQDFRVLVPTAR